MKSLKRISLIMSLGVLAIGLASPASASAAQWINTEHWEPLKDQAEIEVSGNINLNFMGSGLSCPVDGEATLSPGDEGEITEFAFHEGGCTTFGSMEGCEVADSETSAPWPMLASDSGNVLISGLWYYLYIEGGCTDDWEVEAAGDIIATPNSTEAMSSWKLSGPVTIWLDGWPIPQELAGELQVEPAQLYGIEVE